MIGVSTRTMGGDPVTGEAYSSKAKGCAVFDLEISWRLPLDLSRVNDESFAELCPIRSFSKYYDRDCRVCAPIDRRVRFLRYNGDRFLVPVLVTTKVSTYIKKSICVTYLSQTFNCIEST